MASRPMADGWRFSEKGSGLKTPFARIGSRNGLDLGLSGVIGDTAKWLATFPFQELPIQRG
jgi:hypothetical protein